MSKYPSQPPCKCAARLFPHRADQYCQILRDEQAQDEYETERRLDERERARYVNALNRNAAK